MMRSIQMAVACVAVMIATTGQVQAGVLTLNYSTANVGGGYYQYDFTLILTNQDGSFLSGQNFNWIIFGDVPVGLSPINDFGLISSSFPDPNMLLSKSSGGHNGPTFLNPSNFLGGGWLPTGVNDFVSWSGISSNNITSGLRFSTLVGSGTMANFENANYITSTVPEPTSIAVFAIGACIAGLGAARRRREKQHVAMA